MSNNMKFLLLNITLLAGMYCNCEYSRCAGCCKKYCGNGDNENENIYKKNEKAQDATATYNIIKPGNCLNQQGNLSNNNVNGKNDNKGNSVKNVEEGNSDENNNNEDNKNENNILYDNNIQLPLQDNNNIKNEINNNKEDEQKDNENAEEQKDLYFKIEGAVYNNKLGCFGNNWFDEYDTKRKCNHNNKVLLYELEEQQDVKNRADGTLVYSPKSKELRYTKGGNLPDGLKDSDHKWAIFKVTTLKKLKKQVQKGESHIFYCSDVSTLDSHGLFKLVNCWSIEILAANTQGVKTFSGMFLYTVSYLEQDAEQPDASGFIGLEKLDFSSAEKLQMMFHEALFKQKTIDSLGKLRPQNGAYISEMFYVNKNSHIYRALYKNKNSLSFRALNEWIEGEGYSLRCSCGSKYEVFFQGQDNKKNKDILPDWYEDKIEEVEK